MSQQPIVYSATWCGHCTRLKSQLDRAQVSYLVVDVDQHPEHLERLAELNGGSWLIPTVELPDGTALVNPPAAAVVAAVKAGHTDDRPVLEQAHRPGSVRASGPTGGG